MTLRLPPSLPYDFVDEMIDSTMTFGVSKWDDCDDCYLSGYDSCQCDNPDVTFYEMDYARPIDGCITNVAQPMIGEKNDYPYRREEDKDGYIIDATVYGWKWTAEKMTDEEIDRYLKLYVGND